MTAGINNFGGYYRTEFYVKKRERWGPSSKHLCTKRFLSVCNYWKELILGFNLVRGIESRIIKELISARRHGDFQTFDDFNENTNIPFEQLVLLIRVNALKN